MQSCPGALHPRPDSFTTGRFGGSGATSSGVAFGSGVGRVGGGPGGMSARAGRTALATTRAAATPTMLDVTNLRMCIRVAASGVSWPLHGEGGTMDPIAQFKENAKQGWSTFAPMESLTVTAAPKLVRFAGVTRGASVLDVGSGTGVVAVTAARLGASVTSVDPTPELVARARENAAIAKVDMRVDTADVESLPYEDGRFDIVLSQFGHMFAPSPDAGIREMLRVLKPGGVIAFSTWPPDLFTGRVFTLTAEYAPAPPPGVAPPTQWGVPHVVRERLGDAVSEIQFTIDTMWLPTLSPAHAAATFTAFGPMGRLVARLRESDPPKLAAFTAKLEALVTQYLDGATVRQDFLMTRAVKR